MIRTFVILTFALLSFNLLNLGTSVYSVDSTRSSTPKITPVGDPSKPLKTTKEEPNKETEKRRGELKDPKATEAAMLEEKSKKVRTLWASGSAEIKETIKAKKEGFESQVKAKREEAETKIKAKRDEFKTKLQALKDEKKKEIVQRIDTNISEINKKRTDHFTEVLNKLTSLLDKAKNRLAKAEGNGKDVSAVKSALTKAETGITTAKGAVTNQAAKQYVINVTEEAKLGQAAGSIKQQLDADLKSTHKIVQDARVSLVGVLKSLSKVSGVDEVE